MKSFSMPSFPSLLDLPSHPPLPHATLCFGPALNPGTRVREGGVLFSVLLYSSDPSPPTPPKMLLCHLWSSSVSSPPSVAPSSQPLYINKIMNLFSILREERNLSSLSPLVRDPGISCSPLICSVWPPFRKLLTVPTPSPSIQFPPHPLS